MGIYVKKIIPYNDHHIDHKDQIKGGKKTVMENLIILRFLLGFFCYCETGQDYCRFSVQGIIKEDCRVFLNKYVMLQNPSNATVWK